jgi:formamidopyrimidine-DNA glycosylase
MPELPDLTVYVEALGRRVVDATLEAIRIANPFVLRSTSPSPEELTRLQVSGVGRLGKRIVIELEGDHFVVIHLMIAGRLRWRPASADLPKRSGLAAFDFSTGTMLLTEAGSKRRASLHLVASRESLRSHDPGGLEVFDADLAAFRERLRQQNHTLKRALTDPRLLSGIGNAYSDEILHRSRLSPFKQSSRLTDEEMARLYEGTLAVLRDWTDRVRTKAGDDFPEKVTAFREGMAVHGRYRQPCPDCGHAVQRIRYASNEANYCARCQTGGRLLADRSLSRLLKADWPKTIEELEQMRPDEGS